MIKSNEDFIKILNVRYLKKASWKASSFGWAWNSYGVSNGVSYFASSRARYEAGSSASYGVYHSSAFYRVYTFSASSAYFEAYPSSVRFRAIYTASGSRCERTPLRCSYQTSCDRANWFSLTFRLVFGLHSPRPLPSSSCFTIQLLAFTLFACAGQWELSDHG